MLKFQCPSCKQEIFISEEHYGKSGTCKHCKTTIKILVPSSPRAFPGLFARIFRPGTIQWCAACERSQLANAWEEALKRQAEVMACGDYLRLSGHASCLRCGSSSLLSPAEARRERARRKSIRAEQAAKAAAEAHRSRRRELDWEYQDALLSGNFNKAERIIRKRRALRGNDAADLLVDNATLRSIEELRELGRR